MANKKKNLSRHRTLDGRKRPKLRELGAKAGYTNETINQLNAKTSASRYGLRQKWLKSKPLYKNVKGGQNNNLSIPKYDGNVVSQDKG